MSGVPQPPRPGFFPFLVATAGLSGAVVMAVEVLGARVVGPFFGVSLFVWTSLITVTLVALAAGYAVGGIVADRWPRADSLYGGILLAGLAILAVPFARGPILTSCLPLGLRLGALASAFLLFGPALFFLGSVSPYVVRLGARDLGQIGRTVGFFAAVSTAGSFAGTVLTGFFLIGWIGVNRIFFGCGFLLVLLAAAWAVFFRGKRAAAALVLLPLAFLRPEGLLAKTGRDGTAITEVYRKDTHYGLLKVVDYRFGDRQNRELLIDGMVQGGVDLRDGRSTYEYSYFLTALPFARNPGGRTCLTIGLGAGVIPAWFEKQGVRSDVIEISPEIARIARDHFGLRLAGELIVGDARAELAALPRSYDFVILDVFAGESTPGHVLTSEALRLVKSHLNPGGVAGVNLIGSLRREPRMVASVVRTLESLFRTVEVHPIFDPDDEPGFGNVILLAHDLAAPPPPLDPEVLDGSAVHPLAREGVRRFLPVTFRFGNVPGAILLTDDFNPIDLLDLSVKEEIRRGILAGTDPDVLL
jgi:spermidine synthase